MSDQTLLLSLLVVLALLVVLVAFAVGYFIGRHPAHRAVGEPVQDKRPEPEKFPDPRIEWEDTPSAPEPPALKIDPNNPPSWKVYRGAGGPTCNCHNRRIETGQNILMWPDPENEGAYRLFHEGFIEGMVPPRG